MRLIFALRLLVALGCASTNGSAGSAQTRQAAQAANSNQKDGFTQAKVQQWFSTETPETLPPDKIKKLSLGVAGFGGAY